MQLRFINWEREWLGEAKKVLSNNFIIFFFVKFSMFKSHGRLLLLFIIYWYLVIKIDFEGFFTG